MNLLRIKSPSGIVHAVDYQLGATGKKYATVCHNSNGPSFFSDFLKDWPLTREKITCKICLRRSIENDRRN